MIPRRTKRIPVFLSIWILAVLCAVCFEAASRADSKAKPSDAIDNDHPAKMAHGLEIFKKHIQPLLTKRCVRCHGGEKTESELDLTDREGLLRGGQRGPGIIVGDAKESLLYKLVNHSKDPHMPRNGKKLPEETIAQIAAWIDNGAPYDKPLIAKKREEEKAWIRKVVSDEDRQFWSFQPLRRASLPAVKNESWCRNSIDRFILAKIDAAGIEPNPPASKEQLIRRAFFDLVGLPPTPEEVRTFANNPDPDSYGKLIDHLLASPHFGERWARHWLDLARFAESHGFEHDYDRPSAYHYRDFAIKAINDDLPFDTFVKWQLAGDEIAPDNNEALKATGYLAAGVHSTQITANEVEKHRYDEMDDMLATIGTSMLGLTFSCARCHDHKFDPIPQADYYRMLSTFTTTVRSEIDLDLDPAWYQRAKAAFDQEHAPFLAALKKFETEQLPSRQEKLKKAWESDPERFQWSGLDSLTGQSFRLAALVQWQKTTDPEWQRLYHQVEEHQKRAPKPKTVKALISSEGLPAIRLHTQGADFFNESYFLRRGDPNQKEGVAKPSYLQVLMTGPDQEKHWRSQPPKGWRTSFRRKAFADWITDVHGGAGHLLARVMVNRLWQHHMGRGIVATPSDFGTRGERPTHPELLDWLAGELINNGWRLKPIHKLIVTSAVYLQSSHGDEAKARVDSDNRLFWRRPPHRLEAEVIRDALLAISDVSDLRMYGPGTLDPESKRRSIYFTVKRSKLMPMMQVFDAPEALGGVAERPTTTIAPQALLLMNNPNVRSCAKAMAKRITDSRRTSVEEAVESAYLIALARQPAADELADGVGFVSQQTKSYQTAGQTDPQAMGLADFCQILMCLNEFVYVE
jgi:cytochrome c553